MKTEAQRPLGVTILAVLDILGGIGALLLGLVYMALSAQIGKVIGGGGLFALFGAFIVVLGIIFFILGILAIAVGWGFWKGSGWAWIFSLVLYVIVIILGVASLTVGDVASIVLVLIGALLVYYMSRPNVKAWFGKA